jgi:hypothetical protein
MEKNELRFLYGNRDKAYNFLDKYKNIEIVNVKTFLWILSKFIGINIDNCYNYKKIYINKINNFFFITSKKNNFNMKYFLVDLHFTKIDVVIGYKSCNKYKNNVYKFIKKY